MVVINVVVFVVVGLVVVGLVCCLGCGVVGGLWWWCVIVGGLVDVGDVFC